MRGRLTRAPIVLALSTAALAGSSALAAAQARRPATPPRSVPAEIACPAPLGQGVRTGRAFCDVLAGRHASEGIIVKLPKRTGPAVLSFDLHNRHTYSAEQERAGRAFARYTATIGVLTLDNTLLSRFVVRTEFRRASDLFDRVDGGAGPGGVKAVAPTGAEPIEIEIPQNVEAVSILGEKLAVVRADGGQELFTTAGRPIAVISQPLVEYRAAPTPKQTPVRRPRRR